MKKIAVVTGGNRGLGYEICREMDKEDFEVVLVARDEKRGVEVARELGTHFFQADVACYNDILALKEYLEETFGRLDVLVNNAGIFPDTEVGGREVDIDTLKKVMEVNTYGPLLLIQTLLHLMEENHYGRIVNLSSGLGQLTEMGPGFPAYRMSKASLNVLTRIFSQEVTGDIKINAMCPGWCRTGMGGEKAPRSPEEGIKTALYLATLPEDGPTGKFFRDNKEISW